MQEQRYIVRRKGWLVYQKAAYKTVVKFLLRAESPENCHVYWERAGEWNVLAGYEFLERWAFGVPECP